MFSFLFLVSNAVTLAQDQICQVGMSALISTIRDPHSVKVATEVLKDSFCHGFRYNESMSQPCVNGVSKYWNGMTQVVFEVHEKEVIQDICNRTVEEPLEWNCLTCQTRVKSSIEIMYREHWNQFYGTLIGPSYCQNSSLIQDSEACRTFMEDFGELAMEHLFFQGMNELRTPLCFATFGQCEGQNECIQGINHLQEYFQQDHVVEASKVILKEQVCPFWNTPELPCQDIVDIYWPQIIYRAGNSTTTPGSICQNFALFVPEWPVEPGWNCDVCQNRIGQIQSFLKALELPLVFEVIANLIDYDDFCTNNGVTDDKCLIYLTAFVTSSYQVLLQEFSRLEPTSICHEVYDVCGESENEQKAISIGGHSQVESSFALLVLIMSQWPLFQILK